MVGSSPPGDDVTDDDRIPLARDSPHPLVAALETIRRDPVLLVPFFVVGLALAALDWLRRADPLPTPEHVVFDGSHLDLHVTYVGYPTGVSQTTVPLESLVALHPHLLGWGLASYVLPLLAVTVAGVVTMARPMGREPQLRMVVSLFGFVLVVDLTDRLLGSVDALQGMGLWGLPLLALLLFVMVRLFAVPGLLVAGRGLPAAIGESNRLTAGRGWQLAGLVLAFGLGAWLLADVSTVGALLSTAIVAPVHAVAIVVVLDASPDSALGSEPNADSDLEADPEGETEPDD
ncbi:hypothetical protein [Natrarchaeobaculum aegyptiacum]|uniref:Uncharacterized protein n=1 Tax=Natrarchaeobaculum aegyptiacum TaxID=745377 RepID=A0A2Z2HV81_9EURY|nr:hypothetical protein [Natrarchaeobaculum aegyptiacum]ARS90075.1 hypothetical protein B1756_10275 [Natrarchaeobaculum aegyptiacum]